MVDTKQTKMLLLMKMLLYITTEGCVLESNRLRPPHLSSYIFQHLIVFETDKCSDLIVDSVFCIILTLTIDSLMSNCCEPFTRFWRTSRCLGDAWMAKTSAIYFLNRGEATRVVVVKQVNPPVCPKISCDEFPIPVHCLNGYLFTIL